MELPAESSRPAAICCPSITELCILLFSSWSKRATSPPSGASRTTIAKPNTTGSRERDGNSSRKKRASGSKQPQSSRASCHRERNLHETHARLVFAVRRAVPQGPTGPRVGGRVGKPSRDAHRGQPSRRHETG